MLLINISIQSDLIHRLLYYLLILLKISEEKIFGDLDFQKYLKFCNFLSYRTITLFELLRAVS